MLSFRILYKYLHFWIRLNLRYCLYSLPILTIPTANAILFSNIHSTMIAEGILVPKRQDKLETRFKSLLVRATALSALLILAFVIVVISIFFWTTRTELLLQLVSILSIYGLVLLWMVVGYLSPTLIFNPGLSIQQDLKKTFLLILKKPFPTLMASVVSSLLFVLGAVLLGPILLVIPVARSLILYLSYMYLTDNIQQINLS